MSRRLRPPAAPVHPPLGAPLPGSCRWSATPCRCQTAARRCRRAGGAGAARRLPPCSSEGTRLPATQLKSSGCLLAAHGTLHPCPNQHDQGRHGASPDLQALAARPDEGGRAKVAVGAAAWGGAHARASLRTAGERSGDREREGVGTSRHARAGPPGVSTAGWLVKAPQEGSIAIDCSSTPAVSDGWSSFDDGWQGHMGKRRAERAMPTCSLRCP